MAHGLADQQFRSYGDIEKCLDSWIASRDTVTVFEFYQNDGKKLWLTMGNTLIDSFVTIFFTIELHFPQKNSGNLVAHLIKL